MISAANERYAYWLFASCFILTALAAYAVGPVPLPWLGQVLAITAVVWLGVVSRFSVPPGIGVFIFFTGYALAATFYNSIFIVVSTAMPSNSTTGYLSYISLRFFTLASFASFVALTYWLLERGLYERLIRFMTWMCLILSVLAIYMYFAQLNGWWEPSRTRLGTGGGEQMTHFSYAFHRAMGTFREPSHFAEFMILPFLLTLSRKSFLFVSARTAGITALFLTGSLSGIAAILAGLAGALFLLPKMSKPTFRIFARLGVVVAIGLGAFSALVVSKKAEVGLIEVLLSRAAPIEEEGMDHSNRAYIYNYFKDQKLTLIGDGFGNSNLKFSRSMNNNSPVAFLSLFINVLLSLGYLGMMIFVVFLLRPFFVLFMNRRYLYRPDHYLILASFFAWIVLYSVLAEELSLPFAIVYSLLIYSFSEQARKKIEPVANDLNANSATQVRNL